MTKTKRIISWVLAGLLTFIFFGAGATKLMGVEMQIKNLESWGYPLWFRFPIGLIELVLAIAILIPRFRKLAIYGIFAWAVVAVITHLQAGQAQMIIVPIFISVIAEIILWLKRENKNQLSLN